MPARKPEVPVEQERWELHDARTRLLEDEVTVVLNEDGMYTTLVEVENDGSMEVDDGAIAALPSARTMERAKLMTAAPALAWAWKLVPSDVRDRVLAMLPDDVGQMIAGGIVRVSTVTFPPPERK